MATGGQLARLRRQIDDDPRPAGRDRRERSRGTGGLRHVPLPAPRDDNLAVQSPAAAPQPRSAVIGCGDDSFPDRLFPARHGKS